MSSLNIAWKYLLLGFGVALLIHLNPFSGCSKEDIGPDYPDLGLDLARAEEDAEKLEKAFSELNRPAIYEMLTDQAFERSAEDISLSSYDLLLQFAKDFDKRKIVGYGDEFIEFSFDLDGLPYTVDFALQEDGSFKLSRL